MPLTVMVIHNSLQVWRAMSEQLKIVRCYWGDMYRVYWCAQVTDFTQYLWDARFVLSDILYEWWTQNFKRVQVHEICQCYRKMKSYCEPFSLSLTETLPLTCFRRTPYSPRQFLSFPVLVSARHQCQWFFSSLLWLHYFFCRNCLEATD